MRVDFGEREIEVRRDLWHARLTKMLSTSSGGKDNVVYSEMLRYWLEEAQDLELSKDDKCERLNEMVYDVDTLAKALR